MENNKLKEQTSIVVDAREKAREANCRRLESLMAWQEEHEDLYDNERLTKEACQKAEEMLREMALQVYAITKEKAVAPGIGIRVRTCLNYDSKEAMGWALEHKLALKLDTSNFEKIAKTSNLPFVSITEEPQATIATELKKEEK